jgi:hypothetical protein
MRLAFVSALALGIFAPLHAASRALYDDERRIGACIHASARGHPWLERTLWALRDTEGGWIGAAVRNRNDSYDLGPMQVNDWWVPRLARMLDRRDAQVAGWLRSDPCFNVEVARWIFLSSLARTRDFWMAVGLYHSPNLGLRTAYARVVWSRYRRRFTQGETAATRSPARRSQSQPVPGCSEAHSCMSRGRAHGRPAVR